MGKKIKKHIKKYFTTLLKASEVEETLVEQSGAVPLNRILLDRISFSVLRDNNKQLKKIQNISYDIFIENKWEWIVRYDDHGGNGPLHRHYRVSLDDEYTIESTAGIKNFKQKDEQLTWVFKDIRKNYIIFRLKFLKNNGLDLY